MVLVSLEVPRSRREAVQKACSPLDGQTPAGRYEEASRGLLRGGGDFGELGGVVGGWDGGRAVAGIKAGLDWIRRVSGPSRYLTRMPVVYPNLQGNLPRSVSRPAQPRLLNHYPRRQVRKIFFCHAFGPLEMHHLNPTTALVSELCTHQTVTPSTGTSYLLVWTLRPATGVENDTQILKPCDD